MRVLDEAVRHGSFSAAAEALGMSQPAVSYQIRRIEQQLGFDLLRRRNTGVELTAEGRALHEIVSKAVDGVDQIVARRTASARPSVRLRTDYAFSAFWLVPRMQDFRRRHPEIDIQVVATQRHQPAEVGEADVSVIFGLAEEGAQAPILVEQVMAVCSPRFAQENAISGAAAALSDARLIHLAAASSAPWIDWANYLSSVGTQRYPVKGDITFNTYSLVAEAAIAGEGVALGWMGLIDGYINAGMLVPAGPVLTAPERGYLLLPPKHTTPGNEALVAWLLSQTGQGGD